MNEFQLATRLRGGGTLICAWAQLAHRLFAHELAGSAFDAVIFDLQHGLVSPAAIESCLTAVHYQGGISVVRIPVADNANASRYLDFGAQGIIAPMINSVADAEAFVAATKFPPLGQRSYGPARVAQLMGTTGDAIVRMSNRETVTFAMIETRQALEAAHDIVAVAGIDGVFLGPSDLSLSLSAGAGVDTASVETQDAIRHVANLARDNNKVAGIYAATPEFASRSIAAGYQLIALMSDVACLHAGAKHLISQVSR